MLKKSLWSPRESRRQMGVPKGLGGGCSRHVQWQNQELSREGLPTVCPSFSLSACKVAQSGDEVVPYQSRHL